MNPCIRLPDCHGRSCGALPIDLFFLQKQQGASDELPFAHDHGRLLRTGRHYTKRSGPQSPQRWWSGYAVCAARALAPL